jgi:SAM-dependent methyltransferase
MKHEGMSAEQIAEANRAAWNAVAPVHRQGQGDELQRLFATPGASCLDETATAHLGRLGVQGKRVAQLCCNNGRELISICNLGAASGTGFDISDAVIEEAIELAKLAGARCEFVRTDACEVPREYDGAFDLVYVSVGALGWIPDIGRFFACAGRLLDQAGNLLIYEMHPVLDMYDPASATPEIPRDSYFRRAPFVETTGLDYVGNTNFESPPQYWFHHTLADIFTAVLASGLQVVTFEELAHDISTQYPTLAASAVTPPMSYALTAVKPVTGGRGTAGTARTRTAASLPPPGRGPGRPRRARGSRPRSR